MKKYIRYFILSITVILLTLLFLKNTNIKKYETNLFYMDTYINIKVYTNNKEDAKKAFLLAQQTFQKYHELVDRYDEKSELYQINHNNQKEKTLTISKELYHLIEDGLTWYQKTDGLFHINMGDVIDIWKQYREKKEGIPTEQELKNTNTDINNIQLLENYQIKNTHPNIDLGGIAKGKAVSELGEQLKKIGVTRFIINAGGNVSVGEKYSKKPYQIGIESPEKKGEIYKVVTGENISVVTSGSYERFYEYNGTIYHHIIDPNTKYPANYMKSVTVITEDSELADILSTTLFLMSVEDGKAFLKKLDNVEAIWYLNDGTIIKTEGIKNYE